VPDAARPFSVALGDVISIDEYAGGPGRGTGDPARPGSLPRPDAVTVIDELNQALRGVAVRHTAAVADVAGTLLGHRPRAGDPNRPDPRLAERDLWSCRLIEPNAWGAGGVRTAFRAALRA
jgi:hypothetical protein